MFREVDCLCMPSLSENFGNAAAEASVAGVPVVVSRAAGVSDWLGELAFVVSGSDERELADALAQALTGHSKRHAVERMGLAAEIFDWRQVAAAQERAYLEMLG